MCWVRPTRRRSHGGDGVDALVIFGATGDLAKLETFPGTGGTGERDVLNVPVVGVAKSGWDLDAVPRLRRRVAETQQHGSVQPGGIKDARAAPLRRRRPRRRRDLPRDVRCAQRGRAGAVLPGGAAGRCSAGSPRASPRPGGPGGAGHGREAVRHRPGRRPAAERADAPVLPRGEHLPGGPLAGPGPGGERALRPVHQRGDRAAAQPRPRGEHPDHHGRGVRRRRPRAFLRRHRGHP